MSSWLISVLIFAYSSPRCFCLNCHEESQSYYCLIRRHYRFVISNWGHCNFNFFRCSAILLNLSSFSNLLASQVSCSHASTSENMRCWLAFGFLCAFLLSWKYCLLFMCCRRSIVKVVFQLITLQYLPDSGVMPKDSVTSCQFDGLKEESLDPGSLLLGPWSMNSFELAIYKFRGICV